MSPLLGVAVMCLLTAGQAVDPAGETPSPGGSGAPVANPVVPDRPLPPSPRRRAASPSVPLPELWRGYVQSEEAGDTDAAVRRFAEIRRLRVERNIGSEETIALALVARGAEHLAAGSGDEAERDFARAEDLAPGLPDGYYGEAVLQLKRGFFGVVPSIRSTASGLVAFLPTPRGQLRGAAFVLIAGLLAGFFVIWVLALTLLFRHGGLLRHDIEEWLGPARGRSASLALALLLVLLPVVAFQGWGWLPLWWLAILFPYFNRWERAVSALAVAATVFVGPAVGGLERRVATARSPLYQAALAAVEGEPNARATERLASAFAAHPEDRDLAYLLASAWRRAGRVEQAAALYRRLLTADPTDAVARNNLANLEFLGGDYDGALNRYREGAAAGGPPAVVATAFYNQSIAHLEKFEYQAFNEAKSNADRVAPGLVAEYDHWKYDSGDYAVVDLGLSREDVWRLAGRVEGDPDSAAARGADPLAALANRFTAGAGVFIVVAFLAGWIRGSKAFTVHCSRCGTAFCRHCHLGKVVGDLCSQCHHLFVVRDGVSGPARNRKMLEVQMKERRRSRLFRLLSVLSPGAGHVYARETCVGVAFVSAWYALIAGLLTSRLLPLTEVSSELTPPWGTGLALVALVMVWVIANRLQPNFEVVLPRRRRPGRPGQGE